MVVLFALLAGIGLAGSSVSAAQYQYGNGQYGKKVTICHKGRNTITVSVNALPAHKAHGDVVGTCAQAKAKKANAAKAAKARGKSAAAKANH
jgi:hypothetical protein